MRHVIVALGGNVSSKWGNPQHTLAAALNKMSAAGVGVKSKSALYLTLPQGGGRQAPFINAVAVVAPNMGPAAFLRLLKRLEQEAGRRLGRHWGPRPLDLDILSAGGVLGGRARGRRASGRLILPHPEIHRRAFVLVPLADVAPHWVHPGLHRSVRQMLQSPRVQRQLTGIRRLDRPPAFDRRYSWRCP